MLRAGHGRGRGDRRHGIGFHLRHIKAWEAMRILDPDTCRPFSQGRKGLVLGEGAGILVLENLDRCQSARRRILGEIAGFGITADAGDIVLPSLDGASGAIRACLADSGLAPRGVGLYQRPWHRHGDERYHRNRGDPRRLRCPCRTSWRCPRPNPCMAMLWAGRGARTGRHAVGHARTALSRRPRIIWAPIPIAISIMCPMKRAHRAFRRRLVELLCLWRAERGSGRARLTPWKQMQKRRFDLAWFWRDVPRHVHGHSRHPGGRQLADQYRHRAGDSRLSPELGSDRLSDGRSHRHPARPAF